MLLASLLVEAVCSLLLVDVPIPPSSSSFLNDMVAAEVRFFL